MFYDFTDEIPESQKVAEFDYPSDNWDERLAKEENKICCIDCRFFDSTFPCCTNIGMRHKPCEFFAWS